MCRCFTHMILSFVPINVKDMKLIDFIVSYSHETNCKSKLKEYMERKGVVVSAAGATSLLEERQGVFRVQAVPLQAKHQM